MKHTGKQYFSVLIYCCQNAFLLFCRVDNFKQCFWRLLWHLHTLNIISFLGKKKLLPGNYFFKKCFNYKALHLINCVDKAMNANIWSIPISLYIVPSLLETLFFFCLKHGFICQYIRSSPGLSSFCIAHQWEQAILWASGIKQNILGISWHNTTTGLLLCTVWNFTRDNVFRKWLKSVI